MHELIRFTAHSPWSTWPEAAAIALALVAAPFLAALWPDE